MCYFKNCSALDNPPPFVLQCILATFSSDTTQQGGDCISRLQLTEGKPLPLLIRYSLPVLGGSILQQLYSMVDSIIVGQFEGTLALAAVGSSFPITLLALALAQGLSMGANVVIAQLFGAQRLQDTKTTITTTLIVMTTLGLLLSILGGLGATTVLQWLNTDPNVFEDAVAYLHIYFIGCTFLYLFNALNGIFSALGDTKIPFLALAISTILNIGLDLLFVVEFGWGVAGVAWATTIAQGFSALFTLCILRRRFMQLKTDQPPKRFTREAALRIARVGLPSMFQQSIMALSITTVQGLVNTHGDIYVAGFTAATKLDSLALSANIVFSNTTSSYSAQNLGAGKPDRIRRGYFYTVGLAVLSSLCITALIYSFTPELLSLFLKGGEENPSMVFGSDYIRIVSLFYPLMGWFFVTGGLLRGLGKLPHFISSSMVNMVLRVVFAYTLTPMLGELAIAVAIPMGWCVGMCVSFVHFRMIKWDKLSALR